MEAAKASACGDALHCLATATEFGRESVFGFNQLKVTADCRQDAFSGRDDSSAMGERAAGNTGGLWQAAPGRSTRMASAIAVGAGRRGGFALFALMS